MRADQCIVTQGLYDSIRLEVTNNSLIRMPRYSKPWLLTTIFAFILLIVLAALLARSGDIAKWGKLVSIHTPGELIRHAKRRLEGHDKLEAVFLGPLQLIQLQVERPVPPEQLPTLGKGQQDRALPQTQYLPNGQPIEAPVVRPGEQTDVRIADVIASTADEIVRAINTATAGQTIQIAPGHYVINRRVDTRSAGSMAQPITVRASQPGQVTIEFDTLEGFYVSQPFWVFENLHIRGVCKDHGNCEHAFHIVGKASSTVVRNNLIEDFNAHIKVNGTEGAWPDDGLLQYNTGGEVEHAQLRAVVHQRERRRGLHDAREGGRAGGAQQGVGVAIRAPVAGAASADPAARRERARIAEQAQHLAGRGLGVHQPLGGRQLHLRCAVVGGAALAVRAGRGDDEARVLRIGVVDRVAARLVVGVGEELARGGGVGALHLGGRQLAVGLQRHPAHVAAHDVDQRVGLQRAGLLVGRVDAAGGDDAGVGEHGASILHLVFGSGLAAAHQRQAVGERRRRPLGLEHPGVGARRGRGAGVAGRIAATTAAAACEGGGQADDERMGEGQSHGGDARFRA